MGSSPSRSKQPPSPTIAPPAKSSTIAPLSTSPNDFMFKLLLIGDSGVGKTSLLFRFADDTFNTSFITTIGIDFKIKKVTIGNYNVKFQVWDTAGQERFREVDASFFRGAHGLLFVFDLTQPQSFHNIKRWLHTAPPTVQKVLLCNKQDLHEMRIVDYDIAQQLADLYQVKYVELSAKNAEGVEEAFMDLGRHILLENGRENVDKTVEIHKPWPAEEALLLDKPLQGPDHSNNIQCHKRGISSKWLYHFYHYLLKTHDSKIDLAKEAFTTRQATMFIVELTKKFSCRLYDLVPLQYRGTPNVFLSHAWSDAFGCVCHCGKDAGFEYVWLDVICVNQHHNKEQQEDIAAIAPTVKEIGHTVLCFPVPYKQMLPLMRSWCIYEIVHTPSTKLQVFFPFKRIYSTDMDKIKENIHKLDMQTAQAVMIEDKEMIDKMLLQKYDSFEIGNKEVQDILMNAIATITIV